MLSHFITNSKYIICWVFLYVEFYRRSQNLLKRRIKNGQTTKKNTFEKYNFSQNCIQWNECNCVLLGGGGRPLIGPLRQPTFFGGFPKPSHPSLSVLVQDARLLDQWEPRIGNKCINPRKNNGFITVPPKNISLFQYLVLFVHKRFMRFGNV